MNEDLFHSPPVYVPRHLNGFVLPTRELLSRLMSDLACMHNCDYDINELITIALASIEIESNAELQIVQEVQTTKRFFHIPLAIRLKDNDPDIRQQAINDCDTLTNAWFNFSMGLLMLYKQLKVWDEDGVARMYFKRLLGLDILLCRFPD